MTNLFDYLTWRGDIPFENDPFNEIDGMIMARFAYAPFDGIVPETVRERVTVMQACRQLLQMENLQQLVLNLEDVHLYEALAQSIRYRDVELCNFRNLIDNATETQFSAFTAKIMDGLYCITFRGTDNTLIGWKEDCNMAFTYPVPCQRLAQEYLEDTGLRIRGKCILTGHSKGGNIAVYAGAFCSNALKKRIVRIYNYDGPGFVPEALETKEYQEIMDRICTFVPQGSVFGMLFGHREEHIVIHSEAINGLLQHNMYTWEVIGRYFIGVDEVTRGSRIVDETVKNWVSQMAVGMREKFVESLYAVVSKTNATTLNELGENWMANMRVVSAGMKNMDPATKEIINQGMKLFKESAKNTLAKMRENNKSEVRGVTQENE